jgi:hypothetical protein
MKKIYSIFFCLITTLSFSQQVLKKITPTQISLLALANGYSLPETCGIWNIDIGNSSNWGNVSIYTNTNTVVSKSETVAVLTTLPNEVVGNSTFVWDSNTQSKTVYTLPNSYVSLSFFTKRGRGNCDADVGVEGIITTWDIPFTQTDGSVIPDNTKIVFSSPSLTDLATGSTLVSNRPIWFEWYNNTWNAFFTNPVTGNPVAQLEDWGASLYLQNIEQLDNFKLYPNPTCDIVHISTPNETINQINVYDLTGRLLKSQNGNSKNEIISIQELPDTIYLIEVKTKQGIKIVKTIKI